MALSEDWQLTGWREDTQLRAVCGLINYQLVIRSIVEDQK